MPGHSVPGLVMLGPRAAGRIVLMLVAGFLVVLVLLGGLAPVHAAAVGASSSAATADDSPRKAAGESSAEPLGRSCGPIPMCGDVAGALTGAIGDAVGGAAGGAAEAAAGAAFDAIAAKFGEAATDATAWLWSQLDSATSVDVRDEAIRDPMLYVGGFALVVLVGLLASQAAASALRQDPGGLMRALRGTVVATIGCVFALAVIPGLCSLVDAMSYDVVKLTTGDANAEALGPKLVALDVLAMASPVVMLLVAVTVIGATVCMWAALMVRKVLLLIAVVFAALAFAGGAADLTSKWIKRWLEVVFALIISKFLIVVILSIGYNFVAKSDATGLDGASSLGGGLVLMLIAGFSPFLALKFVSFAGDELHHHLRAGSSAAQGPVQAVQSAPQKLMRAESMASHYASKLKSKNGAGGQAASSDRAQAAQPSAKPTTSPAGAGTGAGTGAAGSAGGSAAGAAGGAAGGAATAGTAAAGVATGGAAIGVAAAVKAGHAAVKGTTQAAQSAAAAASGATGQATGPATSQASPPAKAGRPSTGTGPGPGSSGPVKQA